MGMVKLVVIEARSGGVPSSVLDLDLDLPNEPAGFLLNLVTGLSTAFGLVSGAVAAAGL